MTYARKGILVSLANKKIHYEGESYKVDGVSGAIILTSADNMELVKGRRNVIRLSAKVRPLDSRTLTIKIHNDIYKKAVVSGPSLIDQYDDGEIVLTITPRVDMDLNDLEYILKLLVEV